MTDSIAFYVTLGALAIVPVVWSVEYLLERRAREAEEVSPQSSPTCCGVHAAEPAASNRHEAPAPSVRRSLSTRIVCRLQKDTVAPAHPHILLRSAAKDEAPDQGRCDTYARFQGSWRREILAVVPF